MWGRAASRPRCLHLLGWPRHAAPGEQRDRPVGKTPLTLLLSATLWAASRAMALATVVDTGAPCGCGRMRLGEGDRRPGPAPGRSGGSSRCPCAGAGVWLLSQGPSAWAWGHRCLSLVSGALGDGFGGGAALGWGAGGTRRSRGTAADTESTDSPCAESVRTATALASRLRRRTSSTVVLSAVGKMTSATCGQRSCSQAALTPRAPLPAGRAPFSGQTCSQDLATVSSSGCPPLSPAGPRRQRRGHSDQGQQLEGQRGRTFFLQLRTSSEPEAGAVEGCPNQLSYCQSQRAGCGQRARAPAAAEGGAGPPCRSLRGVGGLRGGRVGGHATSGGRGSHAESQRAGTRARGQQLSQAFPEAVWVPGPSTHLLLRGQAWTCRLG